MAFFRLLLAKRIRLLSNSPMCLYYNIFLPKEKEMFEILSDFLKERGIEWFAPVPLACCRVVRPYLLERAGIASGSAVMLAVPYLTRACLAPDRNLSAYAVPRDYHGFFDGLFGELLPFLRERFPAFRFAGFADHSPIAEVEAAACAGLGVIGENGLLLTEPYSSYVFLGELITDAPLPCSPVSAAHCPSCGRCREICPAEQCGGCLSALTQKKGELTSGEQEALLRYGSVWGCDLCQEVCPYTRAALERGSIFSRVPYFAQQTLPHLTAELLDRMSDTEFAARAYAWRGRKTIRRNLILMENARKFSENSAECGMKSHKDRREEGPC